MLRLKSAMENGSLYTINHSLEDCKLKVSILNDQDMTAEQRRELGQDLSHFPHAERRAFAAKMHQSYQLSQCSDCVKADISSLAYYQFMCAQGCFLYHFLLDYDSGNRCYHYKCLITVE